MRSVIPEIIFEEKIKLIVAIVSRKDQLTPQQGRQQHSVPCRQGPWPDLPEWTGPSRQGWKYRSRWNQGTYDAVYPQPRQRPEGCRLILGESRKVQCLPQEHG
jgi:hypothetical protein